MHDRYTRRQSLSAIATVFGTIGAGTVAGKPSSKRGTDVRLLKGTANKPVSTSEVEDVQRRVLSEASRTGPNTKMSVIGAPGDTSGEERFVSAYALKMTTDGEPLVHIEYSRSSADHTRAESVAAAMEDTDGTREFRQQLQSQQAETGTSLRKSASADAVQTLSSGSGFTFGSDWVPYGIVNAINESEGNEVNLTAQPAAYTGSVEEDEDLWGATGYYTAQPEVDKYGGLFDRHTQNFEVVQDMGSGIPDTDFVAATRPSGDKDGSWSQSFAMSAGTDGTASGEISWSYSQPDVQRNDHTDTNLWWHRNHTDEAAWYYVPNDADDERVQVRTGSIHWLGDAPGCSEDDSNLQWNVGDTEIRGVFDAYERTQHTITADTNWFGWVCP